MANPSGIKAGAAYVELLVKDNALTRGLESAAKKLAGFGQTIRQRRHEDHRPPAGRWSRRSWAA